MNIMLRKNLLVSLVGLFCCCQSIFAERIFYVKSQSEFEALPGSIKSYLEKISQGGAETITVYFFKGTYKFDQNFIFVSINRPNVSIHFTANPGEEVHFIGGGNEYVPTATTPQTATHYIFPLKGNYCRGEVFVDQDFNLVPISDSGDLLPKKISRAASRLVKVSKVAEGKYPVDQSKFKLPAELSFLKNKDAAYFKNKLICFKLWFAQSYGTILKTDNESIYFYHARSSMLDTIENNPDWDSFKGFPLFYITNVTTSDDKPQAGKILVTNSSIYIPKGISKLYECERQLLAYFYDVYLKELKFTNLNFSGAANFDYDTYSKEEGQPKKTLLTYDGISNYRSSLFSFTNTDNIVFQNCEFTNIGSTFAVSVATDAIYNGKGGFTFEKNKAYNIGGQVVQSYAKNTKIKQNSIHETGLFSYGRPDPILVISSAYVVESNNIYNFTGNGITIGYNVCYPLKNEYPISGIVKGNELYMTSAYRSYLERYTLEDSHAIYFVNHQTESYCEDNIIHDFEGYKFSDGSGRCNNKAIVIDCGGYNVTVKKNLAYNLADLAFSTEYNNLYHPLAMINIHLYNNVFFAPYRFMGNPAFPTSSAASGNYMAVDTKGKNNALFANIQQQKQYIQKGNDITDEDAVIKDGKCYITKDIASFKLGDFVQKRLVYSPVSNEDTTLYTDKIWSAGQFIYIRSSGKQTVYIYDRNSILFKTVAVDRGDTTIPVATGIYFVKMGKLSEKLFVNEY